MKPVAEIHANHLRQEPEQNHWCREVLLYSGDNPHDFLNGENTRVKLFTADQLRKAKIEMLRDAAERFVLGSPARNVLERMIKELES